MKRFGRKSGAGFYTYDDAGRRSEDAAITKLATEHAQAIGAIRSDVSDDEIVERCVSALVNEGLRLLEEGIAERASDLDVVYRHGYGFPAHRGGPLFFADTLGLHHVLESMRNFHAGYQGWAGSRASTHLRGASRYAPHRHRIHGEIRMTGALIVSTARTPIGRAFRGR